MELKMPYFIVMIYHLVLKSFFCIANSLYYLCKILITYLLLDGFTEKHIFPNHKIISTCFTIIFLVSLWSNELTLLHYQTTKIQNEKNIEIETLYKKIIHELFLGTSLLINICKKKEIFIRRLSLNNKTLTQENASLAQNIELVTNNWLKKIESKFENLEKVITGFTDKLSKYKNLISDITFILENEKSCSQIRKSIKKTITDFQITIKPED